MKKLINKLKDLKKAGVHIIPMLLNFIYWKLRFRVNILAKQGTKIKGLSRIIADRLEIATLYNGLLHGNEKTTIRVAKNGFFQTFQRCFIGQGCIIDVAENATLILDDNVINKNTQIHCSGIITIFQGTRISFDCLIMDTDFHEVDYQGKKEKENKITICHNCLIGAKVTILKSTFIAPNCVVAAGSVVRGTFDKPNCLIAGNPARVIKENITWKP